MNHRKLLIIGSGPAGYTAAIYAARAGLEPLVFAGIQPGGQLMLTGDVENYPGYKNGVRGPEMMEDFRLQAERFGTDVRYENVVEVDFSRRPFVVVTDGETRMTAEAVIIATGASAKWLGLENETRLYGAGVSACAVCDGFFYRGKDVAVVGGGDTAAEESTYLSKLCNRVYLLVRRGEMRASRIMRDRVLNTPNIQVLWHTETVDILGENHVEAVRVRNNQSGSVYDLPVAAFFVAIGHQPNTEIFKGQIETDANGYIVTRPGSTYTSVEGVFAAGDVQDHVYRQAVTAAGSGCMAALDAERWLAAQGLH
ncbi:MAG: thioredoxin-disulfide reductase [Bacteroidia bacterium]|nr:thioredoxin-disulfide reductase [Bacteroidia bacterium]MDW8333337.1 thioredoxin-disulfide reductase [Bacteroidia bacterium]